MRDSQRSAVYAWEHKVRDLVGHNGQDKLTLDECVTLIHRVWGDYHPNLTPPEIRDGRGTHYARGGRWKINLPKWCRTSIIVLHETAHSLQRQQPWHGQEFARLVLELWARYAQVPKAKARHLGVTQKPRRVRFAPPKSVPQPVTKEWKAWHLKLAALRTQERQLLAAEPPKHRNGAQ